MIRMSAKRLTEEQRAGLIRDYLRDGNTRVIAARYGVQACSVHEFLKNRGLVRSRKEAQRIYALNEHAFDVLTPEAAYFVGLLITDGCLAENNGRHLLALQMCADDVDIIEAFRAFLGSEHPIKFPPVRRYAKSYNSGRHARFNIHCPNVLAARLRELGVVPQKTHTAAAMPVLADNRDFWRGVIDGDGSVTLRQATHGHLEAAVRLCGASHTLLDQFLSFAVARDPRIRATVRVARVGWETGIRGNSAARLLRNLYGGATVALARKAATAAEITSHPNWL
jgi:hypothetical protein